MFCIVPGIVIELIGVPENALSPIDFNPSLSATSVKFLHSLNAFISIFSTVLRMFSEVRPVLENASDNISFKPSCNVISFKLVQLTNALLPIPSIVFDTSTFSKKSTFANASSSI